MRKYTFIELVPMTLTGAEEFYIAAEIEGRIAELESALKSVGQAVVQMQLASSEAQSIGREACKLALKVLPPGPGVTFNW